MAASAFSGRFLIGREYLMKDAGLWILSKVLLSSLLFICFYFRLSAFIFVYLRFSGFICDSENLSALLEFYLRSAIFTAAFLQISPSLAAFHPLTSTNSSFTCSKQKKPVRHEH